MRGTFLLTALAASAALLSARVEAQTYRIDPDASSVKWYATKVTGKHDGTVRLASGAMEFDGETFVGGEAIVDMRSIAVSDIQDPADNAKLTNHLKSADFFDVEAFPEARIAITSAAPAGDNAYDVQGNLTIKGQTHPVSFRTVVVKAEDRAEGNAEVTIDRSLYDVRYGSGKFFENLGDKLIHDEFRLAISAMAEPI